MSHFPLFLAVPLQPPLFLSLVFTWWPTYRLIKYESTEDFPHFCLLMVYDVALFYSSFLLLQSRVCVGGPFAHLLNQARALPPSPRPRHLNNDKVPKVHHHPQQEEEDRWPTDVHVDDQNF